MNDHSQAIDFPILVRLSHCGTLPVASGPFPD